MEFVPELGRSMFRAITSVVTDNPVTRTVSRAYDAVSDTAGDAAHVTLETARDTVVGRMAIRAGDNLLDASGSALRGDLTSSLGSLLSAGPLGTISPEAEGYAKTGLNFAAPLLNPAGNTALAVLTGGISGAVQGSYVGANAVVKGNLADAGVSALSAAASLVPGSSFADLLPTVSSTAVDVAKAGILGALRSYEGSPSSNQSSANNQAASSSQEAATFSSFLPGSPTLPTTPHISTPSSTDEPSIPTPLIIAGIALVAVLAFRK